MDKVIILENMAYTRYRLKEVLSNFGVSVIDALNSRDFFNKICENKDDIRLIILEINLIGEDGFEVIKRLKRKKISIPIMVLTSENKRNTFIKCVKEGIDDYILKPYDSKFLLKRVKSIVTDKEVYDVIEHNVDYNNYNDYLDSEISKAKASGNKIEIFMLALIKSNSEEEKIEVKNEYLILTNIIYKELKNLFNDSGFISKFGLFTFIGAVANADEENIEKVKESIFKAYDDIKLRDFKFKNYHLESSWISFPNDGNERKEIINKLDSDLKNNIEKNTNALCN